MTKTYEEYNRRIDTLLFYKPEIGSRYTRDQILLIYEYYRQDVVEGHAIESLEDYIWYEGRRIMEMAGDLVGAQL
jgi:hypothetical protein